MCSCACRVCGVCAGDSGSVQDAVVINLYLLITVFCSSAACMQTVACAQRTTFMRSYIYIYGYIDIYIDR